MSRFFQNLTSRYNIYFNGIESYRAGLEKIREAHQDNYSGVLPVYLYADESATGRARADMDRVVKKASKVISLKSITAKPEIDKDELSEKEKEFLEQGEYNLWVDDSYLLMGKGYFYLNNLIEALTTFEYVQRKALDEDLKAEAVIWEVKLHLRQNNLLDAGKALEKLDLFPDLEGQLKAEALLVRAAWTLAQDRPAEATAPLKESLEYQRIRYNKTRHTYLLAQLYDQTGQAALASEAFREVIKMNPAYEMEFNARISLAGAYDPSLGNARELEDELMKMLKDAKNKDFEDQIYYALGELSMSQGQTEQAIQWYKQSARAAGTNPNQKGLTYLALADHYFAIPEYVLAQAYYDSALMRINEDFPGYAEFSTKGEELTNLVSHLNTLSREDSLQRIAGMSENERNQFIDKLIQSEKQKERETVQTDNQSRYNVGQFYENQRRFEQSGGGTGEWYFYNQSALAFGRTEFERKWGNRKLEDNWRRSNKNQVQFAQSPSGQQQAATDSSAGEATQEQGRDFYLRDLPLNDSLLQLSDERIVNALLGAGDMYKREFADREKAAEMYEQVLIRYPAHPLRLSALFRLYTLYQEVSDPAANTYREQIITGYPESEYALMLSDPEAWQKILEKRNEASRLYEQAYSLYKAGDYAASLNLCRETIVRFPEHELTAKFSLLAALNLAQTEGDRTAREALMELSRKYPGTEEKKMADEVIGVLNRENPELKQEQIEEEAREIYLTDTTQTHLFVLLYESTSIDLNRLVFDLINFNIDYLPMANLRTEGSLLANTYSLFTVRNFSSFAQALEYYKALKPAEVIQMEGLPAPQAFIISESNFEVFTGDQDPEKYMLFFRNRLLEPNN